ncbi:MAG: DUF5678 domain-containing protein [Thermoplasmata archaeon]|nr:DUF5678 domain-containing protein [Thermoplasmata archaeon]
MKRNDPAFIDMGTVSGPEGHWVVVLKGKVIASNEDVCKMLKLADKYSSEDVVVTKILYPNASFF